MSEPSDNQQPTPPPLDPHVEAINKALSERVERLLARQAAAMERYEQNMLKLFEMHEKHTAMMMGIIADEPKTTEESAPASTTGAG